MAKGRAVEPQQQVIAVKAICEAYSSNRVTIESACNSQGIGVRTFTVWCRKNADYAELYKKASEEHNGLYRTNLIEKARTALEKLIEGSTVEEIIQEGEFGIPKIIGSPGTEGSPQFIPSKFKRIQKSNPPNPAAVIFALTNLDSQNFKNKYYGEVISKSKGPAEPIDEQLNKLTTKQLFVLKHGRKPEHGELDI